MKSICFVALLGLAIGGIVGWYLHKHFGRKLSKNSDARMRLLVEIVFGFLLLLVGYMLFSYARAPTGTALFVVAEYSSQVFVALGATFGALAFIYFFFGSFEHRELLDLLPKGWTLGNTHITFLKFGWKVSKMQMMSLIYCAERVDVLCYFLLDDPISQLLKLDGPLDDKRPELREIRVKWADMNDPLIDARAAAIAGGKTEKRTLDEITKEIKDSYLTFGQRLGDFCAATGMPATAIKHVPTNIINHDKILPFSLICIDEHIAIVIPPHTGDWEDAPKLWLEVIENAKSDVIKELMRYIKTV